jgi:ketosteroid isomerase-like protein
LSRVVRKPLTVRGRSRRTPEEHLVVRFPRLFDLLTRGVTRLSPESRIRQAMIWRATEQGLAATNRRDYEAVLPRYDPAAEIVPAPELASVGLAASYRGRDGFLSMWDDWDSAWAGHAQWEATELVDLGDRLLMLGRMRGTGGGSGAEVDREVGVVWTLRDGKIIREEQYLEPAQALEAVGLPAPTPGASGSPRPARPSERSIEQSESAANTVRPGSRRRA